MKTTLTINGVTIGKHGVRFNGKYSPAHYSKNVLANGGKACITIYARDILRHLPRELGNVRNDTDFQTDYFETDRVTFVEGTPEYDALLAVAK